MSHKDKVINALEILHKKGIITDKFSYKNIHNICKFVLAKDLNKYIVRGDLVLADIQYNNEKQKVLYFSTNGNDDEHSGIDMEVNIDDMYFYDWKDLYDAMI